MATKAASANKMKSSKGSVFKGGAAPGPVAATTIMAKKQGPKAGASSKGGYGTKGGKGC